jgi:hypothetical protein
VHVQHETATVSKCVTHYICGTCEVTIRIKMKGGRPSNSCSHLIEHLRTATHRDTYNDKISDSAHPEGHVTGLPGISVVDPRDVERKSLWGPRSGTGNDMHGSRAPAIVGLRIRSLICSSSA